jgi:NodT family efflux transporter outer membrane factor (OMF) lipoprotein
MSHRSLFCGAVAVALSACSLAPPAQRPAVDLPARYAQAPSDEAAPLAWRTLFTEAPLQQLIDRALAGNHDLRLALLQAETTAAQYGIARADRFPTVALGAEHSRQRLSESAAAAAGAGSSIQTSDAVRLGITAFELDFFGRVKSLGDAAWARYLASDEGRRAAQLVLVGAVAQAYYAERQAAQQLALTRDTLADWQQSLALTRLRHEAQQASGVERAQAEGQVAQAEADLEGRDRALQEARHALALLVGTPTLPVLEAADDRLPTDTAALPAGLPADLLVRRPDLRQAEQALAAARADIGAARAAFFPRITLTGSAGYASDDLGTLFRGPARTWSFVPQVTLPLFDAGRLKAELRVAELRRDSAVVGYEKAVQTALREVADGPVGQATYDRQLAAQQRVVDHAAQRRRLAEQRYRAGQDSRLELLDAQRQHYAAQQAWWDLYAAQRRNRARLYVALGGGGE